jgi:polyisoprenoid-binding protein YceI
MESLWKIDKNTLRIQTLVMRLPVLCLVVASALLCPPSRAQVPVFQVTPIQSSIRFNIKSSRPLTGNFDKWNATLTFASRDPTSAVLQVEIQTASVHSRISKNDDELKSQDLLNVAQDPVISFKSNKVVQTGKTTYDLVGAFTMRGVSKPATLNLVIADQGGGSGYIQGIIPFDLKDYGMTSKRKIDERGEVDLNLKAEQVSGPQLIRKRFQ